MRARIRKILASGALAVLAASVAHSDNFHVSTIQDLQTDLTSAAGNGADNVIWITNGYYTGNFNFAGAGGHNLTIQAEPGVPNTAIVLDGDGHGRDLVLSNPGNGNFTVRGLTFLRNCGDASQGALSVSTVAGATLVDNCRFLTKSAGMGIEIVSGSSAVVSNCLVNGSGGSGIYISGVAGSVSVQSCTIATNYSNSQGGGLVAAVANTGALFVGGCSFLGNTGYRGGGVSCPTLGGARVTLTNNTFSGNLAFASGGGVYFDENGYGTAATLSCNTFVGNSAPSGGGIVSLVDAVTVSGNAFTGNRSTGNGGAGAAYFQGNFTITDNAFVGNSTATNNGNGGTGGGLWSNGGAGTISSNTFIGNVCFYRGGGVRCDVPTSGVVSLVANTFNANVDVYGPGGGADCEGQVAGKGSITLSNNTFVANSALSSYADYGYGGGANCYASDLIFVNNVFQQNQADSGGGIAATANTILLSDNLVARNSQTLPHPYVGGGIYLHAYSNLFMINNTVFGNTAVGDGGGVAYSVGGTWELLDVYNNIIWGNSAIGNGTDVWLSGTGRKKTFLYNDVHDMYGVWDVAQNLLDVDPQFFDPVNGDHHLRPASPCVNSGTNGAPAMPATDLDGKPRIFAGTVDLGCYEFNNTFLHPADTNNDWVVSAAEYNAYAVAWKNGQSWPTNPVVIPADFATRAGYLLQNGGAYTNDGSAQPTCWKLRP